MSTDDYKTWDAEPSVGREFPNEEKPMASDTLIEAVARAICAAAAGVAGSVDVNPNELSMELWEPWLLEARAALAAIEAAGYVPVPREPTEEMVLEGFDQLDREVSPHAAEACWRAMISAARGCSNAE